MDVIPVIENTQSPASPACSGKWLEEGSSCTIILGVLTLILIFLLTFYKHNQSVVMSADRCVFSRDLLFIIFCLLTSDI